MKKSVLVVMLLVAVMFTAIIATVYAQTIDVTIGAPNSSNSLGVPSSNGNGYWIGQFPITIDTGTQTTTGQVYCMTSSGTVYEGASYQATEALVPTGSPTWQEISYILTWNAPTTGDEAAIDQVAIWELLGQNPTGTPPQYSDFTLDQSIITQATNLVSSDSGMNVALQGDKLTWLSPFSGLSGSTPANPGETIPFQVQLSDSSGDVKSNVQIDFTASITPAGSSLSTPLDSSFVSPTLAYTDDDGIAHVSVTVPPDAPYGSTVTVTASTQSVWPVEYLDLTTQNPGTQNLIGVSPALSLTTSYSIHISGTIFVLPESAWGGLSALVACAASFIIYYKVKPHTKASNS